ncbi:MAG: Uma2 family endonuclease [Nostoc sp. EfeVER01]|uniref:Uma2 family endonuclease n=1 Tax=unclassified Nostoc TaxID=2593658 RepID=UPI002AD35558|nr:MULTISPECIES: Uma2 family endonuclease [unclassified Nostoc]MDZ7946059.1 Uma2 family endonuclease [Nostoc sp. EfeVER01]MDZ7995036.1 Uma2 family endonuclease [Nostoc sp. EspVER01]
MNATTTSLPSTLKLKIDLTDEQFFQMCQKNRDYRFERTASGELLIMPPTASETGNRNFDMVVELGIWNKQTKLGKGFDSSTGFTLPNGAERSPDVSWVKIERWNALTPEQQEKFAPICPDFVVELRYRTDSLKELQEKMQEYIENGTQLGWLIDRKNKRVEIYRPGKDVEILDNPASLSGENILSGFVLDLQQIM